MIIHLGLYAFDTFILDQLHSYGSHPALWI